MILTELSGHRNAQRTAFFTHMFQGFIFPKIARNILFIGWNWFVLIQTTVCLKIQPRLVDHMPFE